MRTLGDRRIRTPVETEKEKTNEAVPAQQPEASEQQSDSFDESIVIQ